MSLSRTVFGSEFQMAGYCVFQLDGWLCMSVSGDCLVEVS